MTIELILADPHPVMLEGLDHLFRHADGFAIRACERDGLAAWEAVRRLQPHILVHELQLGHKDGLSLIRAIRDDKLRTQMVVFTSMTTPQAQTAMALGARGVISKNKSGQVLVECVRAVMNGQAWVDRDLMPADLASSSGSRRARPLEEQLTARELGVAQLVLEGLSNKRIALRLNITEGTTKLHLHHIYQKLQCPGRMALMIYLRDGRHPGRDRF